MNVIIGIHKNLLRWSRGMIFELWTSLIAGQPALSILVWVSGLIVGYVRCWATGLSIYIDLCTLGAEYATTNGAVRHVG